MLVNEYCETNLEYAHVLETEQLFIAITHDHIGLIRFQVNSHYFNWLSPAIGKQLQTALDFLQAQSAQGIIFCSNKPHCFIQGIRLGSLDAQTESKLIQFSLEYQQLLHKITQLPIPTICLIEGSCFGFGLELALACDYRIAAHDIKTQLAMPQIKSGFIPFAGGCFLLERVVGLKQALLLLLSGKKVYATSALKMGLVDEVTSASLLVPVALKYLRTEQNLSLPSRPVEIKRLQHLRDRFRWLRHLTLNNAEQQAFAHSFDNYPAVAAILKLFRNRQEVTHEQVAKYFASLFLSPTSCVLRQMEKTHRQMRHQYTDLQSAVEIKKVAVLGSGFMGAGIAYITAVGANLPVRIKDINPAGVQKALRLSYLLLQREVHYGRIPYGKIKQLLYLISGGESFVGKQSADIVIEAVNEDLALKQALLQEIEDYYDDKTIFATNTLTLSINAIAANVKRSQNVIGVHYFAPVSRRQMVEIIPHSQTSSETIAKAIGFVIKQGKIPLLVKDSPGFFINRVMIPFLLEAYYCVLEGESIGVVDRALREFGFGKGPLELIDDMGLDILVKMLPKLEDVFGMRFAVPKKIDFLLRNERKGRKNRRGFYLYHSHTGDQTRVDPSIYQVLETHVENNLSPEQIVRRCVLMMINEATYCLDEQIIRDKNEGNVASVQGMYFPESRGGIYAYIDHIGVSTIVSELGRMMCLYGERFRPSPWLIEQAKKDNSD